MHKRAKRIGIVIIGALVAIALTGCPSVFQDNGDGTDTPGDETSTSPEEAEQLADEGTTALNEQDWEAAHDKFAQAVQADPSNGLAALGYAMTEMATVATDSGMVTLAQDHLGLVDYPDSMNTLFSETWLEEIVWTEETDGTTTTYTQLFPEIANENATDGDGNLKYDLDGDGEPGDNKINRPEEKAYAFGAYFVQQNPSGFNDVVDELTTVLEGRLESALQAVDAIPDDAQITFSWDMFFDTEDAALQAGWPVADPSSSSDPQLLDLVIGKEEVQFLGAYMRMVRHQVYIGQVFDYSLPLQEYWDAAWTLQSGDTLSSYPTTPFASGFLQESSEASAALSNAEADLQEALNEVQSASAGIRARGSGSAYSISEGSDFLGYFAGPNNESPWADLSTALEFEERTLQEVSDSLSNEEFAYFPVYDSSKNSYDTDLGYFTEALNDWPTESGGHSPKASFNFGKFYAAPQITVSNFLDLYGAGEDGAQGDPRYYTWEASSDSFSEVTTEPSGSEKLYIRVPDISLGGAINTNDLDKLPVDDPATKVGGVTGNYDDADSDDSWDYDDADGDGKYDSGETVETFNLTIEPLLEGPIEKSAIGGSYGDAITDYYMVDLSAVSDSQLEKTVKTEKVDYLRSYLRATGNYRMQSEPLTVVDKSTWDIYVLPAPVNSQGFNSLAAHSFVDEGTQTSFEQTSTGSFWWALVEMTQPQTQDSQT